MPTSSWRPATTSTVVVATGGVVSLRPVLAALRRARSWPRPTRRPSSPAGTWSPAARAWPTCRGRRPAGPVRQPARLAPPDRLGALGHLAVPGRGVDGRGRGLVLTASGGPFLDASPAELAAVTPERALRHPTWTMGAKITIDSATLVNKGLEVIEAHWPTMSTTTRSRWSSIPRASSIPPSASSTVPSRPSWVPRHAPADPVRHDLPRATALTGRSARPRRHRPPRLPRARRGPVLALRIAREAGLAGPRASAP